MTTLRDLIDFSILVPVIVGICRFNKLNVALKLFCCYLFLGAVNEFCSYLIPKTPFRTNIQHYIFLIIELVFLLAILQMWMDSPKKIKFLRLIFVTFFIIMSISAEIYTKGMSDYRFSFNIIISVIIIVLTTTKVLVKTISKKSINQVERKIRILTLSTLLFSNLYLAATGLIICFFYNPLNAEFYINLFFGFTLLNAASYIFYTIVFLWAPPKEKFLLHSL